MVEPKSLGSPSSVIQSVGAESEIESDAGKDLGNIFDDYYQNPFASLLNSPNTVENKSQSVLGGEDLLNVGVIKQSIYKESSMLVTQENEMIDDSVDNIQASFESSKDDDEYSSTTKDDDEVLRKLNEEDDDGFVINEPRTANDLSTLGEVHSSFYGTTNDDLVNSTAEDDIILRMLNDEYDGSEAAFVNSFNNSDDASELETTDCVDNEQGDASTVEPKTVETVRGPHGNELSLSSDTLHKINMDDDEHPESGISSILEIETSEEGKKSEVIGRSVSGDNVHHARTWYRIDEEHDYQTEEPGQSPIGNGVYTSSDKNWCSLNPFDDDMDENHIKIHAEHLGEISITNEFGYENIFKYNSNPFDNDLISSHTQGVDVQEFFDASLFPNVNLVTDDSISGETSPGEYRDGSEGESYDEKRQRAKEQLLEEIRLADEAKFKELSKLRAELFDNEKQQTLSEDTGVSIEAESDDTGYISFDDYDPNTDRMSNYFHEDERRQEQNTTQTALMIAKSGINLSQIQLLQSIILAEKAALNGSLEFRTADISLEELNSVYIPADILSEKSRVEKLKDMSKMLIDQTIVSAKASQTNLEKHLKNFRVSVDSQLTRIRDKPRHSTTDFPADDDDII